MAEPLQKDELVALYDQHARALRRYVALRLDAHVAQDLVSEVFCIVWERRHTFDRELVSMKAWLYGIATNLIRQHARSEARRMRAWAREFGRRPVTDHVDDRTASAVDAEVLVGELLETLVDLRGEERDVLLLVACADLTPTEIAEVTGTTVATVRSRLFRARTKLRARLGGQEEVYDDV